MNKKDEKCKIHSELLTTKHQLYDACGLTCTSIIAEAESAEYGAYAFELNGYHVRFRVAKITPTKVGQFVTLWKRIENGTIQPYDKIDLIDFVVICIRTNKQFGQFVFPKSILLDKNIFSKNGLGGKRGFRIYAPWDKTDNPQAKKTQQWQLNYFLNIPTDVPIDYKKIRTLYSIT